MNPLNLLKKTGKPAPVVENGITTGKESAFSPFLAAKQEWLERYGDYIQARDNWRFAAFLALIIACASLAGNWFQHMQTKITPYIVEVDKVGNISAVRSLQSDGTVPSRVIQAEIVGIITNWRTVTADIELQKKLVAKLSAYIGGSARGTIQEWYQQNNPYQRAEKVLVSVEATGLPLPVSSDSWRISWIETTRNHTGATLDSTQYEATVSIALVPPKNEAQIIANPGGILVTGLNFGKLLK